MTFLSLHFAVITGILLIWSSGASAADNESIRAGHDFFENKIRPVLVKHCFKCHSEEKQKGKLRLDQRDFVLQGGRSGHVVLPGDPSGSLLIKAIRRTDKELQMPPDDADKLTAEEVQNFIAWIKMGVPFPGTGSGNAALKPAIDLAKARQFWSLKPLQTAPGNSIDQFVLAKLNAAGIKPSPKADKHTLLRRATYDLTGLPPTPEEMDSFIADTSPDAFAKVVERLLDSPQYGVHWARHWFDVARYGDTRWVGAAEDKRFPFSYTYRDWVIASLNKNVPYDRFVTLQLAADQVPDARPADQAALGFLTLGRWFTGTMPDVIDDQIDVVTRGLMGVSAQCARCHDHKYDPISTQDYYSLYGLFAAARMPVDGSGLLAELPEIAARPVDAAMEKEISTLRGQVDEFLAARGTAVRDELRTREKLHQYLLAGEAVFEKTNNEVKDFAKARDLDERLLQRWVRYLKNTTRSPHPVFAPWHALASIPEADFASKAPAMIEKEKTDKINKLVAELLSPTPASLSELAWRYVDLFIKFDQKDILTDADQESLRQVLRANDSPVQVSTSELGQFLTTDELKQLAEMRRRYLLKQAALPERADHFLNYLHESAPVLADLGEFLQQKKASVAEEIRSPEKIAAYMLTAREGETTSDSKFKSLAKSKQVSEKLLRRWMDYLQRLSENKDPVFAAWRVFAESGEKNFTAQSSQLTEKARNATGNQAVAALFATAPASLSEVASRYAELLIRCNQPDALPDANHEAIRQVLLAEDSPLRRSPDDVFDYLTQKDNDGLKEKERKLARLYLESPDVSPRAMALRDSSRSYAQRVFVRGNPNTLGEPAHGGFFTVLSPESPRPFAQGRGRLDLAQAILDKKNPLTARVIVNRVWQWHFGSALVRTPSDFGVRGNEPTHPELLDSLAAGFMAEGWSLKKLHRQILLSSTWQQSSHDNPQACAVDPENRLLWRMNRQRLSFEELRDSLLFAAGRLDATIGGAPVDLTKNIVRRRTVFGTVDRVTLPGFYRYFDFPGADAHVPERHETIVAQQALYLMNNGFVMEQASHVARRTAAISDSEPAARLDMLYRMVLGRSPSAEELSLGMEFVKSQPSTAAVGAGQIQTDPWRYGWGSYSEATERVTEFRSFPFFANNTWRGGTVEIDPELGRASLNNRGGTAGIGSQLATIRRWIAPRAGHLSITGLLAVQTNASQPTGNGVRARIVSSRHGKLGDWIAHGTEEDTAVQDVAIEEGDTIDFVADSRGSDSAGGFTWAPVLRMDAPFGPVPEKVMWDAAKDFKAQTVAPAAFDVWERLAQVLLEANEFMFLD